MSVASMLRFYSDSFVLVVDVNLLLLSVNFPGLFSFHTTTLVYPKVNERYNLVAFMNKSV